MTRHYYLGGELKPGGHRQRLESLTYMLYRIFLQDRSPRRFEVPDEPRQILVEERVGYGGDVEE